MSKGEITRNIKVFISYIKKEDFAARDIALTLARELESKYHYDVFLDREKLGIGDEWAKTIYDNIQSSDTLIVLLERDTAASDWVQREVDVARGAHVSILPLQIDEGVNTEDAIERLALLHIQYFQKFSSTDHDYEQLVKAIERLSKKTRDNQKQWIEQLQGRWSIKRADNNEHHSTFILREFPHPCKIYLATGDMTHLEHIDILVNSENDYMQMARIHESNTLSSALRREGSLMTKGGLLKEDTVQQQLNDQIASEEYGIRPIGLGKVIPTYAGHPDSDLSKRHARYIFHTATVQVNANAYKRKMTPIDTNEGIEEAVITCLNTVIDVDRAKGVISPKNSTLRQQEEADVDRYKPIRSIVFPLFGTGQGGRATIEVVPPMIKGFRDFLIDNRDHQHLQLEGIYLCVFSQSDVEFVERELRKRFDPA